MILRGVFVALVMGIAHGAVPLTSREIQMREKMATVTTKFRAGKEAVKLHVASACPVRLVFQLPEYLSPPRIANRTGQRVILHHLRNGQPFNDDHLVLVYRLGGEVVKMIIAGITDPGVLAPMWVPIDRQEPKLKKTQQNLMLMTDLTS